MTSSVSALPASGSATTATRETQAKDPLGQDAFLKLLVAQLQNQDPLNPMDGMNFVSQLAQFTQLETLLGMRGDLRDLVDLASPPPAQEGDATTAPTQEA